MLQVQKLWELGTREVNKYLWEMRVNIRTPRRLKRVLPTSITSTAWELVKSEEPQTTPDLLHQNLHFNKIPG